MDPFVRPEHIQGSAEWLAHRQNYLGASDAVIIMGVSPWQTPYSLWEQKVGVAPQTRETPAMRRGTEMEPLARKAFEHTTGLEVFPQILYHPQQKFMMASLDGLSLDKQHAVEIKCPGEKAHSIALSGKVPEYYLPQLQHQLACLSLEMLWYYSFDGNTGVGVQVFRDDEYIEELIEKEAKFWECVQTKTPPPMCNRDYVDRNGAMWESHGNRIMEIDRMSKELKDERDMLKNALIKDADGRSSRGGGLTLGRSFPKGRIDYGKIPQLEGIDLEPYRKEAKEQWTLRTK